MVVDNSIFTIQGEILLAVERKPAESWIVLQKQSLFCSLSLTYHSQSVALALLLAKTVLSLWEREKPGSLTYFFPG